MDGTITSFIIAIPQEQLEDLAERLARTRWPADYANDDWSYGANLGYLRELVHYWRTAYDWRRNEREINRFRHYRTVIEGVPIHLIHERGQGAQSDPAHPKPRMALDVLGYAQDHRPVGPKGNRNDE